MEYKDRNDKKVLCGDIINIGQTVNGYNTFIVLETSPLTIVYPDDFMRHYEYDSNDLLSPSRITGITEFQIKGNVYKWMDSNF